MAIQTINLEKFANDEHYTVVELVLHTVTAAGIGNRMASQRLSSLREAFKREGAFFKMLHKNFAGSDLDEIDRQLCDVSERSLQMQELFRMCCDEALLDAVDESRVVRRDTDQAYRSLVELLNALLVVSPNDELRRVETQLNQQAEYVDYRYRHRPAAAATAASGEQPASEPPSQMEAEVRLMTLPLSKKVQ